MIPNSAGKMMFAGNSLVTFEKKYALTEYIPLECSRRNTALSSGKIRMIFWIALKDIVIMIKNSAPFRFWMLAWSFSIYAPVIISFFLPRRTTLCRIAP